MADLKNVVKAIDICLGHGKCNDCPYCLSGAGYTTMNCRDYMLRDALKLLKEQEAVKPVKQIEQTEWTVCGNCRNHIISKWIFCPYCGRSVKWE